MSKQAEIILDGKSFQLPIIEGTENEKAIDIAKLRDLTGYITYDAGFKNTGACKSAITFLDGENGILRYRGYPIEQLAEKSDFVEVSYLLIYGELPTAAQLSTFKSKVAANTSVPEQLKTIIDGFPAEAHPMAILSALVCSLTAFYPESTNPNPSKEQIEEISIALIAKLPTLISWSYRKSLGKEVNNPDASLDYTSNFMKLMFANKGEDYKVDSVVADALSILLILHAEHEQNCSTSTVRIVGSSQASLYGSISAGIQALWGPLHGGANQEVIEMLEAIKADGGDVDKYLNKAKDKNDTFRLMGFGHRVYKNFDPRATIIKGACDKILKQLGINDPVLDIAMKLEEAALADQYFVERRLYPNVDFYSGIIYRALGIPTNMFTVMFALGRLPGWIAQWQELRENKEPIGRPRQIYTGATTRDYVESSKR